MSNLNRIPFVVTRMGGGLWNGSIDPDQIGNRVPTVRDALRSVNVTRGDREVVMIDGIQVTDDTEISSGAILQLTKRVEGGTK